MVPFGVLLNIAKVGDFLIAELPTYFFFSIFTLLVFWWIEICHFASELRGILGRLRWVFLGVNVVIYLLLVVVVIAFAVEGASTVPSSNLCLITYSKNSYADTIAKVYHCILAGIALLLFIGFAVYGTKIVSMLVSMGKTSGVDHRRVIQFTLLASTSAISLLLECALLLYTTFGTQISTVGALIVLIVVEVVPASVMLFNLRQPRVMEGFFEDVVWCLLDYTVTQTTGLGGTPLPPSSTPSGTAHSSSAPVTSTSSDS